MCREFLLTGEEPSDKVTGSVKLFFRGPPERLAQIGGASATLQQTTTPEIKMK